MGVKLLTLGGGSVELVPAATASDFTFAIPASNDTLVGLAATQTLTNKTLTLPVITSIVNSGTLTLPTSTDTLVGRTTTDTLTNKTLTSPTLTTPNVNSAQVDTVSGTAPLYFARAWVNFNGTGTVAIRASGNVSSITDNNTGDYTVNFITAMVDANYVMTGTASYDNSSSTNGRIVNTSTMNTANCRVTTAYTTNTHEDEQFIQVAIFR